MPTQSCYELHKLLKAKHGIDMYWSFKSHETPVLDNMPKDLTSLACCIQSGPG